MDEIAKLEEEVVKEQEKQSSYEIMTDQTESTSEEVKVEMNEDTLTVSHKSDNIQEKSHPKKQKNKRQRQQIDCSDKLIVLNSGNETWL